MTNSVKLAAWAKLTTSLRVTGVRADGYHLLDSEMVSVDLADTLVVSPGSGISIIDELVGERDIAAVPAGSQNLVSRAMQISGRDGRVELVKRIPPGAGLGGGSADAAAILRWAGITDRSVALRLGADVPFCVRGGRARVRGIGEVLEPLDDLDQSYVLLLPPFSVSTTDVYAAWDRLADISNDTGRRMALPAGGNDLEEAAMNVEPRLELWRTAFEKLTGITPRLAGSGSTWFVEGDPVALGIPDVAELTLDGERAAVVAVRTVPAFELV